METGPSMMYTPEQIEQQRIGARLLLMKLMGIVKSDWNGNGIRLWLEQEARELEE